MVGSRKIEHKQVEILTLPSNNFSDEYMKYVPVTKTRRNEIADVNFRIGELPRTSSSLAFSNKIAHKYDSCTKPTRLLPSLLFLRLFGAQGDKREKISIINVIHNYVRQYLNLSLTIITPLKQTSDYHESWYNVLVSANLKPQQDFSISREPGKYTIPHIINGVQKQKRLSSEFVYQRLKSQIRPAAQLKQVHKIAILQFITHFQEHDRSDSNRSIHPRLTGNLELSHLKTSEVPLPDTQTVHKTTDNNIIRETKKLTGRDNRRNVYGERKYSETGIVIPGLAKTSNFSSDVFQKQTAGNYLRIIKRDCLSDRIAQTQNIKERALTGEILCEKLKSQIPPARATLQEQGNRIGTFQFITHFQEHSDLNRTIQPRLTGNLELSHQKTSEVPLPDTQTVHKTTDNNIIRETKKLTGRDNRRNVYGERKYSETGIQIPGLTKINNFSSDVFQKQTAGNYLRIVKRDSLSDRIAQTQYTKGRALPGEISYEKLKSQILPPITTLPEQGNNISILQFITHFQEHSDSNRTIHPRLTGNLKLSQLKISEVPLPDTQTVHKTTDNYIGTERKKQSGKGGRKRNVFRERVYPETGIQIPGLTKINNFSSDVFQKQTAGNYLGIVKRDSLTDRIAQTQHTKGRALPGEIPYEKLNSWILPPITTLPEQGNNISILQFITHFQEHSDSNRTIHPRLTGNLELSHQKTSEVPLPDTQTVHKTTDNYVITETKKQTGKVGRKGNVFGERVYSETGIQIPGLTKINNFSSDVFQKQTAGNYLGIVKRDSLTDRIAQTQHTKGRALPGEMSYEKLKSQILPAITTLPEQGNNISILQFITHLQEHSDSNRIIYPWFTGNLELSHQKTSEVHLPDTQTVCKTTDNYVITETKKQTGKGGRKRNVFGERVYSETGILIPGLTKINNFSSDVFQKQTSGNYLRIVKRDSLTDRIAQTQHTKGRALQREIPYEKLRSQIHPAITTFPEQGNNIPILQFITHLQEHSDSNRTIHPRLNGNLELSHQKTSEVPLPDAKTVHKATDNYVITERKKQSGKGGRKRNVFGEPVYSKTGIQIPGLTKINNFSSDVFQKQTAGNYLRIVKRDSLTDRIAQTQYTKGRALPGEISYDKLKSRILPPITTLPEQENNISILQFITHLQEHSDSNRTIHPWLTGNLELSHQKTSEVPLPGTQTFHKTTDNYIIRETKKQTGRGDRRNVYGEQVYSEISIQIPGLTKINNFSSDVFQKQTAGNYLRIVKRDSLTDRITQTKHTKGRSLPGEIAYEKLKSPILPAKTTDRTIIRQTKKQTGKGDRRNVYVERTYSETGILIPGLTKINNFSSDVFQKQTAGNYLRTLKRDTVTNRIAQTQHTKGRALQSEILHEKLRSQIRPSTTTLPEQVNTISTFQFITHLQEHSDSNRIIHPQLNGNLEFSHVMADVPLPDTGQVKTTDNSTIRETKRQTCSVFGEQGYAKTGILIPDVTKTSYFSSDVFHKQTAENYLKIVRRDSLPDRMAETQHTKGRAKEREMPEIPFEKNVPMKDATLQYAGVRRNDLSSTVKNSVGNRNKAPDLVLKKPVMYSDDKTSEQGRKNIFTHTDEILSSGNIHVTSSFNELNNIADKVYKLIETKISTEKERRGIG